MAWSPGHRPFLPRSSRHTVDSVPSVAKDADANTLDPRRLPPLAFTVSDLRLNAAVLGQLRLAAMPYSGGIRLTEFTLDS